MPLLPLCLCLPVASFLFHWVFISFFISSLLEAFRVAMLWSSQGKSELACFILGGWGIALVHPRFSFWGLKKLRLLVYSFFPFSRLSTVIKCSSFQPAVLVNRDHVKKGLSVGCSHLSASHSHLSKVWSLGCKDWEGDAEGRQHQELLVGMGRVRGVGLGNWEIHKVSKR